MTPCFDRVLTLSPREYEVFIAIGEGLTARQIANLPGKKVAVKTVWCYLDRIREKLGLEDQRQVTCLASKYNLFGCQRVKNYARSSPYKFVEQSAGSVVPYPGPQTQEPIAQTLCTA